MANDNTSPKSKQDGFIWLAVVVLFMAGIFVSDYVTHQPMAFRIVGWIILLAMSAGLAYCTSQGKDFLVFAKDARMELRKVVWPTQQETVRTALLVMAIVIFIGVILWGVDSFFLWFVGILTGHGVLHS